MLVDDFAFEWLGLAIRSPWSQVTRLIPDESLQDSASLPDPDEIAAEIVEDLRAALEEFEMIQEDLARP